MIGDRKLSSIALLATGYANLSDAFVAACLVDFATVGLLEEIVGTNSPEKLTFERTSKLRNTRGWRELIYSGIRHPRHKRSNSEIKK